jgi:hypothetical protein
MKTLATAIGLLLSLGLLSGCSICCTVQECCPSPCGSSAATRQGEIRMDVPAPVHAGVLKVLPGFVAEEFEVESRSGALVYEFEGRSGGKRYEVEVDARGNVLRIDEELEDEESEGDEPDGGGDED